MRSLSLFPLMLFVACFTLAGGHACDDVYLQARDNLVVKVELPNNTLRIAKEATFKVFVLNTMNMDIDDLAMEVVCASFTATVRHSEEWVDHPMLKCVANGGKREHFIVDVKRKSGTPDGRYRMDIRMFVGYRKSVDLKKVDLAENLDIHALPKASGIDVDGVQEAAEWQKALLCADFNRYVPVEGGRFHKLEPVDDQPRFRLAADAERLYVACSGNPARELETDAAWFFFCRGMDDDPSFICLNRLTGEVKGAPAPSGVVFRLSADKRSYEASVPRSLLGIDGDAKSFRMNIVRGIKTPKGRGDQNGVSEYQYWRGNGHSYKNPVSFAVLELPEEKPKK